MNQDEKMTALAESIAGVIKKEGPIPFDVFMNSALYDPSRGYYMSSLDKIGPRGDFITAPEMHPVFAKTLADYFNTLWCKMDRPELFDIVEIGAGTGAFALSALATMKQTQPKLFSSLKYSIIEISPGLRAIQEKTLRLYASALSWPTSLNDIGRPIHGCLIANEVLDAMPYKIVVGTGDGLSEVFVDFSDGQFKEVMRQPSTVLLGKYLNAVDIQLAVGQRAEINLNALEWVSSIYTAFDSGFVVIIDYGYEAQAMFSNRHHDGTLACYHKHRFSTDPYDHVGEQDITVHVDFTSIINRAKMAGFAVRSFTDQGRFLQDIGILEKATDAGMTGKTQVEIINQREAIKRLILPGHMGEMFKVLVLEKA